MIDGTLAPAIGAKLRALRDLAEQARDLAEVGKAQSDRLQLLVDELHALDDVLCPAPPPLDLTNRMSELAESFRELAGRPGVRPWFPQEFDAWAASHEASLSTKHAARFVLSVWDPTAPWAAGAFDMHDALMTWEDAPRAAFLTWIARPWWA